MQGTNVSASAHDYRVVSLFSGGGGLDLGFKQAGFNIVWAIDNARDAVETYRANIGRHIVCADINSIAPADIPQPDIIIGGPPCQSFSLAGNRHAEDARGQLVWTYLEIINLPSSTCNAPKRGPLTSFGPTPCLASGGRIFSAKPPTC